VAVAAETDAATPPIVTVLFAGVALNPVPRIVTAVPAYPYIGLKPATTGPLADLIRRSMEFAFGREPVFVREGGSIGAVLSMERVLKAPVFFLGLSLPEHGYHAPNENFDWPQAHGGMVAFADYFRRIGEMGKKTGRARG